MNFSEIHGCAWDFAVLGKGIKHRNDTARRLEAALLVIKHRWARGKKQPDGLLDSLRIWSSFRMQKLGGNCISGNSSN